VGAPVIRAAAADNAKCATNGRQVRLRLVHVFREEGVGRAECFRAVAGIGVGLYFECGRRSGCAVSKMAMFAALCGFRMPHGRRSPDGRTRNTRAGFGSAQHAVSSGRDSCAGIPFNSVKQVPPNETQQKADKTHKDKQNWLLMLR
jgi:hypothetical protein